MHGEQRDSSLEDLSPNADDRFLGDLRDGEDGELQASFRSVPRGTRREGNHDSGRLFRSGHGVRREQIVANSL